MLVRHTKHGGDVWDKPAGTVDFSVNVNPLGPPQSVVDALQRSLGLVERYPDPKHMGLRRKIASTLGVGPAEVVVGCGSTELIYLVAEAWIRALGGSPRALIAEPTFGEYEVAVRRVGGRALFVFASQDLRFDVGAIVGRIPRGGMVYLCNPNNPTAQTLRGSLVEEVAAECGRRGALLVVDEGFVEFSAEPQQNSVVGFVGSCDNLVVLRSPSKLYAIPGLRVGYAVCSARLAAKVRALQQPWSVGVLGEIGLMAALDDHEFVERSRQYVFSERERFSAMLGAIRGLRVYPSDTNFLLVDVGGTGLSGAQLKQRLLGKGFLVRDCSDFRGLGDHYVRLAVRRGRENEALVSALRQVVGG